MMKIKRLEKIGWMKKYYIWLQGKMKLEFVENVRKNKIQFTWNPSCACFDKPLFLNDFFIKDLKLYFFKILNLNEVIIILKPK
jgi:hypothetical protein